jgi:hypothetical protein
MPTGYDGYQQTQLNTLPPCCECHACCRLRGESYDAQPDVILVAGVGLVHRRTGQHRIGRVPLTAQEVLGVQRIPDANRG